MERVGLGNIGNGMGHGLSTYSLHLISKIVATQYLSVYLAWVSSRDLDIHDLTFWALMEAIPQLGTGKF